VRAERVEERDLTFIFDGTVVSVVSVVQCIVHGEGHGLVTSGCMANLFLASITNLSLTQTGIL
jgi:hypothetical protein